jgi:tRNA (cmo5U34)-methyltransferase
MTKKRGAKDGRNCNRDVINPASLDKAGADYALFSLSVPHHDEFQKKTGELTCSALSAHVGGGTPVIVEAGTGTGITTKTILAQCGGMQVVSVDSNPEMLAVARNELAAYRSQVRFHRADVTDFLRELPPRSIEGFVSAYMIHNLTSARREKLLNEVSRTLKEGGFFINADKIARDSASEHQRDLQNQFTAFQVFDDIGRPDLRKHWVAHYLRDEQRKLSEEYHIRALQRLGLQDAKIVWRKGMEAIVTARKSVSD